MFAKIVFWFAIAINKLLPDVTYETKSEYWDADLRSRLVNERHTAPERTSRSCAQWTRDEMRSPWQAGHSIGGLSFFFQFGHC